MDFDLLRFSLENIHSLAVCGQKENYHTVSEITENNLWLLTTIEDAGNMDLLKKCAALITDCAASVKVNATCCIGEACLIEDLPKKATALKNLIRRNAMFYGQAFMESDVIENTLDDSQILDIEKLSDTLREHDKVAFLNYMKDVLKNKTDEKSLSEHCLYLIKQEILQVTYAHLLREGIQTTKLFHDEVSAELLNKASRSSVDMLRWANHLLEHVFACEERFEKTDTLIQRIHTYIQDHYKEKLNRNTLASEFYLAPEYLSKLYHKKTGQYLKDYIRKYRIERAKELLRHEDIRICDVADAVGIDNFSYFTTLFKNYEGRTPAEYRRDMR
jgi:two-component system response regulator YesN